MLVWCGHHNPTGCCILHQKAYEYAINFLTTYCSTGDYWSFCIYIIYIYIHIYIIYQLPLHFCRHQVMMNTSSKPNSAASKERERDPPSIRFKIQYHVISILPIKMYDYFLKVRGCCTKSCCENVLFSYHVLLKCRC